jgi:O-glycosyl hydrolase
MLISNNAQEAISFIPTLRTALDSANLKSVQIACCDATGWPKQTTYTQALMSANMQNYLGVISSHTYSGFPTSPMNTPLRTWITEGCPEGHPFVKTWYSSGGVTEGMTYANYLAQGFVNANLSAWVFWEGFEINEQSSESHLLDTSGSNVEPSGIFWAFVMWSRWIRPNARRLSLSGSVSGVLTFAAQNTDGAVVVVLTNSGSSSASPSISFTGFSPTGAQAWVTSNSQTAASTNAKLSGSSVSVSVPGHGVVTVRLTSS